MSSIVATLAEAEQERDADWHQQGVWRKVLGPKGVGFQAFNQLVKFGAPFLRAILTVPPPPCCPPGGRRSAEGDNSSFPLKVSLRARAHPIGGSLANWCCRALGWPAKVPPSEGTR